MKRPCMKGKISSLVLFCASVVTAYLFGTWHTGSLIDRALQDKAVGEGFMQGQSDFARELERIEDKIIALQISAGKPVEQQSAAEVSLTVTLLKRMNSLERRLDALDSHYTDGSLQQVSPGDQPGSNTSPENQSGQASVQTRLNQMHDNLETRLTGEQPDPAWSAEIKSTIQATLANLQQNFTSETALVDVDCKSSLCRVEMAHGDKDDRTLLELDMLTALGKEVGESTAREIKDSNGNVRRTVYYFARQGNSVLVDE